MLNAETHEALASGTEVMNGLLRHALSAVETYTHAIGLIEDPTAIIELQKIRDGHRRAERELRECVVLMGAVPSQNPGPWPAFSATAAPGTKAVGCASVLAALRQCEEYAIAVYEDAVNHEDIPPDGYRLISGELLPEVRKHVDELNRLLGGTC
ncbi:hypothetical protein GobsT_30600 [Gemmata obscuriglobus]|uniref:DUF2383 domain-containing protein n=1 Tax=Gemmata obscuriglobus TaxID=114 RepID=A0A2Z3HAU8_9BACT|nr:ferritin-like domain-containing protein [Gemmata obscuriglobus]AWM38744.1 DUF2383 domain-containing protein [Gemmata obscuriglobus]QEG28284.1 hypothetical protein GobsT_30600 [Gemmata obscuriglobus]VTS06103.1 Uncharacterized protein OS=Methylomicrobium alcaliphilum (strain DSM 19304 / NCIMB 14124 / VKM B-2133 / 20Z) GN=MEALZ_2553 PE=4 SV=1 [Gemmata obscuriglobus UQM 2246]